MPAYKRVFNKRKYNRPEHRRTVSLPGNGRHLLIGVIASVCIVAVVCIVMLSGADASGNLKIAKSSYTPYASAISSADTNSSNQQKNTPSPTDNGVAASLPSNNNTDTSAPSSPSSTAKPSPSVSPNPSSVDQSPSNTESSSNTEQYNIDSSGNKWAYSNADFSVEITKIRDTSLGLTYLLADIKINNNGNVIKTGFSNKNSPGSSPTDPAKIALTYNAVYAQNDDYFSYPQNLKGIVIRNGIVYYDKQQLADTLAIFPDGQLKVYKPGETTAQKLLDSGVKNALSFGPILVSDSKINPDLKLSKVYSSNTRSGFGMIGKNHFIGIVTEGTGIEGSHGITLDVFANLFLSYKCTVAYNFDGGQSAAMIFMGKPVNIHTLDNGILFRTVPEVLIIGTSETVAKLNK